MKEITGIKEIVKPENLAYKKSTILTKDIMHYCPGCGHSTAHRILAEIIEEEGLQHDTIGVSPVGCSVFLYKYIDIDWQEAAHGRAPAVATGIKRLFLTSLSLHTRAMATWQPSVLLKQFIAATAEKISLLSLLTTGFMV